jgi:hypothetical protein
MSRVYLADLNGRLVPLSGEGTAVTAGVGESQAGDAYVAIIEEGEGHDALDFEAGPKAGRAQLRHGRRCVGERAHKGSRG